MLLGLTRPSAVDICKGKRLFRGLLVLPGHFLGSGQTLLGLVPLVPLGGGPGDYGSSAFVLQAHGPGAWAWLWNRVWVTHWGFGAATFIGQPADATRGPVGGLH